MTIIQKLQATFLDWRSALFGKSEREREAESYRSRSSIFWSAKDIFTEQNRKTEKLASLARYIEALSALEQKAVRQKKNANRYRNAMKAAMNDRLMIETGRMVYDPAFGAWVVKGADQ